MWTSWDRRTRGYTLGFDLCNNTTRNRHIVVRNGPTALKRKNFELLAMATSAPPMQAEKLTWLIVHAPLHDSGFGNQCGMLLQHVALAALSGRTLVLPPIHLPIEHRRAGEAADSLHADEVFNLSTLAPLALVMSRRHLDRNDEARSLEAAEDGTLTFAVAGHERGRHSVPKLLKPLKLTAQPTPMLAAAVHMLQARAGCEEGVNSRTSCEYVSYCHRPSCRTHTRRACRNLSYGCARSAQRLPNNYLFAHRINALFCGDGAALPLKELGRKRHNVGLVAMSNAIQRSALGMLAMSDAVRGRAAELARRLGPYYFAVHVRLRDASKGSTHAKGVAASQLSAMLRSVAFHIDLPREVEARHLVTLYVASNRPDTVRNLLPAISAALTDAGISPIHVVCWHDLMLPSKGGEAPASQILSGLRAALVEHELCTRAPLGFVGSPFSTWANLIGARRLAHGHPPRRAYLDLSSGVAVPACVTNATLSVRDRGFP